jgi:hypothetical protein
LEQSAVWSITSWGEDYGFPRFEAVISVTFGDKLLPALSVFLNHLDRCPCLASVC